MKDPGDLVAAPARTWGAICSYLEHLGSDLTKLTHDCAELGDERLGEDIRHLKATAREILGRARGRAEGFEGSAAGYIRANPFGAVLAAIGLGTALALIFGRKTN